MDFFNNIYKKIQSKSNKTIKIVIAWGIVIKNKT